MLLTHKVQTLCLLTLILKDHIQLVERFNRNSVTIVSYIHETEVDEFDVDYDQLSENLLYDIYDMLDQYNVGMEKTMDKIRNENY
jgi:hypothetical protein